MEVDKQNLVSEIKKLKRLLKARYERRKKNGKGGHMPRIFLYLQALESLILLKD